MRPEILKKYAAPVPRYTSYPTAPHFSNAIGSKDYASWLAKIPAGARLSLYVHIPFCDKLCWYCGCTTKATRRYEPVSRYLDTLLCELDNVAARITGPAEVTHMHWGGGSPSILSPADIARLAARMRDVFHVAPHTEFAVEVDPRGLDAARIQAFADAQVNRVSIGVQDFDDKVQRAINRSQSFEETSDVVAAFRARGIDAINIDLVYGLPHQSRASVEETIARVISLAPDRIALFGYAHLPRRLPHQRLIDEAALPDAQERFAQANRAASRLVEAGYVRIGLDHFARPGDSLVTNPVRRNFQGYTADQSAVLLGFGASAIGRPPHGYVQNATATADYERRIREDGLATERGHEMSREDEARAFAIERLMCDLSFPASELAARFGGTAQPIIEEARDLIACDSDGLVEADASGPGFRVTEKGRPFVRSICAVFDGYFGSGTAGHAQGV